MKERKKLFLTRRELIFFMYFSMYYFALFISDIAIDNSLTSLVAKFVKFIACILAIIQISHEIVKKEFLRIFLLELFLIIILILSSQDIIGFILLIIGFGSLKIDEAKIFKLSLICISVFTFTTLVLCFTGIVPDIITKRTDLSNIDRHSLGFFHSSNLPLNFFYLFTYYIVLCKGKVKTKSICFFAIAGFLLYRICRSNNAFWGLLLICFILLIRNIFKNRKNFDICIKSVSKNIFSILFVLAFVPVFMRAKGIKMEWWYYYDTIFTNRTYLGVMGYQLLDIHFINFMNSTDYFSRNIVIDNGYMFLLLRYGIYSAILFIFTNWAIYRHYNRNINILIVFIIIAVVNYTDNDFLSFGYLPFMIVAITNINCVFYRRKINGKKL